MIGFARPFMDLKLVIDGGNGAHASAARSEGVKAAAPAVTVAVRKKCRLESMKPPIKGKAIIGGL